MTPEEVFKKIHLAVCDPGAYVPREREERDGETEYESVTHWSARAVTVVLTVVLAEHEKQVREQVAKEIEQVQAADDDGSSWGGGMLRAVEIARGDR